MCNFCLERSKFGSIKARDSIFVLKSRVREFIYASRKLLKSRNHALHDVMIFIDAPLNFPARVDSLLGTKIMSLAFIDPSLDLSRQKLHMLV